MMMGDSTSQPSWEEEWVKNGIFVQLLSCGICREHIAIIGKFKYLYFENLGLGVKGGSAMGEAPS